MYSVRGSGTSGGSVGLALFSFWNPHSTQIVRLKQIVFSMQSSSGKGAAGNLARITVRGTPASTVTPDVSNDGKRGAGPPSGALLDLGVYTVEPTRHTDDLGFVFGQLGGTAGGLADVTTWDFPGSGLYVPPGEGIGFFQSTSGGRTAEVTVYWVED